MLEEELISKEDYEVSQLEKIPRSPYPLPSYASHLLEFANRITPEKIIHSTIDNEVQKIITMFSEVFVIKSSPQSMVPLIGIYKNSRSYY